MRTSDRSVSHPWSKRVSVTSRTAVYGPVRTVVWEGRSREAPPYPDPWHNSDIGPSPSVARHALMDWAKVPILGKPLIDKRVERRLAAVLAADVAGYSRLM